MKHERKEMAAILRALGVSAADGLPAGAAVTEYASRLESLLSLAAGERQRLGELLRAAERISEQQLEAALAEQRRSGGMLGDVLVGLSLLTARERDIVLEFQRRQADKRPSEGKFQLGHIMVANGDITGNQLSGALQTQAASGGRLGDVLLSAGQATAGQVAHGLSLQRKLVVSALIAAMALVAPLASIVPSAEAGQASVNLQVSATVIANARVQLQYQAKQLTITQDDIARGHVDVAAASRFSVVTNSRAGYFAEFHPVGNVFESVQITGLGHPAQLGTDGGTVVLLRGPVTPNTPHALNYHFTLRAGLSPGNYAWPLTLAVHPLPGGS